MDVKNLKKKIKMSPTSTMHVVKLCVRLLLLAAVLVMYILCRVSGRGELFGGIVENISLLAIIWVMFALEMVLRFFPSKIESPGCQKQFKSKYVPTNVGAVPRRQEWWRTFLAALAWIILNGAIGVLYFTNIIDEGILIIIALTYSACDMICILFFCPFQTWIMKNRCCTTCRIYNWDFAMMFTPLVFIVCVFSVRMVSIFSLSLVGLSLALLIEWEVLYRLYPERFSDNTNKAITCANCNEKLCHHKKQLQHFIKAQTQKLRQKFSDEK